jgi:phospholipase/carboxylesterase
MREVRWGGLDCVVSGGSDGRGGGDGPIVVLLHGFGAPGDDLVPLGRELEVPRAVRFVFPAAPLDLGWGRAWWIIDMERIERDIAAGRPRELSEQAPVGLAEARVQLGATLDEMRAQLGTGAPLVLGGFSQGAMLSCDVALRTDAARLPLAGLVLMSGTFLTPREWTPLMPARRDVPLLMSHGRQDPLLPFAHAERLRDAWRAAGAQLEWIELDGGHGIPPEVLTALARMVRKLG